MPECICAHAKPQRLSDGRVVIPWTVRSPRCPAHPPDDPKWLAVADRFLRAGSSR